MYDSIVSRETETMQINTDAVMLSLQLQQFRSYDAMTLGELQEETGLTNEGLAAAIEALELCDEITVTAESGVTYVRIAE